MQALLAGALIAGTTDGGGGAGGGISSLAIFGVFFVAMYFLLVRPQRKRQKEQQQLVESLEVGLDVVTIGGVHGTIDELGDEWVDIQVSADGTVLRVQRQAIARAVNATVDEDASDDDE